MRMCVTAGRRNGGREQGGRRRGRCGRRGYGWWGAVGGLRTKAETGEEEKHMWKTLQHGSGQRRSSRCVWPSGASRWRPRKLSTATCASVHTLKSPETTTFSGGPTTAGPALSLHRSLRLDASIPPPRYFLNIFPLHTRGAHFLSDFFPFF